MALAGQGVVGMHLNRKVVVGVDEFHQQGEITVPFGVNFLSEDFSGITGYEFVEGHTLEFSVGDYGFMARHRGEFPGFAYVVSLRGNTFEPGDAAAAPDDGFEVRIEFKNG